MKIIVGAGGTTQDGWFSLEESDLDIADRDAWAKWFSPNSLDAVLAEHVWEHLTLNEGHAAAQNCFEFLKRGGYLRVAVPDGLHPDSGYIAWVRPETGWNGDDHKVLYDHRLLSDLLSSAGFDVRLLEWWDEEGNFHRAEWSQDVGNIRRCYGHWYTSHFLNAVVNTQYTSLLVDAFKG